VAAVGLAELKDSDIEVCSLQEYHQR